MKTLSFLILAAVLFCGCTAKEGAEFYALQKQNDHLAMTVSNLQQQVTVLVAQNFSLESQAGKNAAEIELFMNNESSMQRNLADITNALSSYHGNFEDLSNKFSTFESQEAGDFQRLRRDLMKLQNP